MKVFSSLKDKNLKNLLLMSLFSKNSLKYKIENQSEYTKELIDLFVKLATGSTYLINKGILNFVPGKLDGGQFKLKFTNIPEIVNPVTIFGLFSKFGIDIEFEGVTNRFSADLKKCKVESNTKTVESNSKEATKISLSKVAKSVSIDLVQIKFKKLSRKVGIKVNIDIKKRGFDFEGEGIVCIKVDKVREINFIYFVEKELFYKIRGLIVTARISADFTHRMIEKIRENLQGFNDLKLANILNNRNNSGPSPGYECSLYAEGKTGLVSTTVNNQKLPETMADECCKEFLKKINKNVQFDEDTIEFLIMFMCLGTGTSHLRLPRLNRSEIELLGFAKEFLNVVYEVVKEDNSIILKINGAGYKNSAREI